MDSQEKKQPRIVGVWESERFNEVESLEMSEERVKAVLSSPYTLQFFIKAIYLSVLHSPRLLVLVAIYETFSAT